MWLLPLPWLISCTGGAVSDDTGTRTTSSPSVDSGTTDTSPSAPSLPALCVNEIMEDNRETLTDDAGGTPSWIELHNPERTDISLAGWTVTDDETEPDRHVFADDLVVPGLGYLLLYADDETDQGSQHLAFELHKIGGRVTLYDADGTEISYGEWIDEWNSDVARARDTDCCSDLLCWSSQRTGTPGASNVVPERDETVLAEAQAIWRYHDTGEAPGPGWREADFDDSAWDSGPAPLGYGDDHQVTEVSYGGDSGDKHPTTWFRRTFQVDDPDAFDDLRLELLYDDGAAVYLNDVEVLRAGLPGGDLTPNTYATRTASGSGETDYSSFTVVPDALVAGENVLAVEVHQAASDSSDLGMDLALLGEILLEPR